MRVLNSVFLPLSVPSLHEQTLIRTADALVRAERVGDPGLLLSATNSRAQSAAQAGDIDEMDRCIQSEASLSDQLDQPFFTWAHAMWGARRAQIAGDTDEAERLATKALQIGTDSSQPDATLMFGVQFVAVSLQRGTIAELVPLLEQMVADAPTVAGVLTATLARAYAETNRTVEARHLLEALSAANFDLPLDQNWLTGMVCYANAAIVVGDADFAEPLLDRLAPWAEQLVVTGNTASGPVSGYLGGLATVINHYDEADMYFAQCAAMSDRIGGKYFAARTDLWWGQMLAKRNKPGDTEKARDLLTTARTRAAAHGYGNVERRAAAALQGLG